MRIIITEEKYNVIKEDRNQLYLPFDGGHPLHNKPNYMHFIDWLEKFGEYGQLPSSNYDIQELYNNNLEKSYQSYDVFGGYDESINDTFFERYPPQEFINLYKVNNNSDLNDINEYNLERYLSPLGIKRRDEFPKELFYESLDEYNFINNLNVNESGLINIYRAIQIPKSDNSDYINKNNEDFYQQLTNKYGGHIGEYWSWVEGGAEPHSGGMTNSSTIILYGLVAPENINWVNTIVKNSYDLRDEMEIEVNYDTPIEIYGIYDKILNKKIPLKKSLILKS